MLLFSNVLNVHHSTLEKCPIFYRQIFFLKILFSFFSSFSTFFQPHILRTFFDPTVNHFMSICQSDILQFYRFFFHFFAFAGLSVYLSVCQSDYRCMGAQSTASFVCWVLKTFMATTHPPNYVFTGVWRR